MSAKPSVRLSGVRLSLFQQHQPTRKALPNFTPQNYNNYSECTTINQLNVK